MSNTMNKTSRIVVRNLNLEMTIYTTSQVVSAMKKQALLIQLGQKHFPQAGMQDKLCKELYMLAVRSPDDFSRGSFEYLKARYEIIRHEELNNRTT